MIKTQNMNKYMQQVIHRIEAVGANFQYLEKAFNMKDFEDRNTKTTYVTIYSQNENNNFKNTSSKHTHIVYYLSRLILVIGNIPLTTKPAAIPEKPPINASCLWKKCLKIFS